MTASKQEKWSKDNEHQLETKSIRAIGAVFDFCAGSVERPSQFWIRLKLELFIRLVEETQRIWRRYLYYGPFFCIWY